MNDTDELKGEPMTRHNDLICRLSHIAANYQTAGEGWWENQGIGLESEPDWPGNSIMLVRWPDHVRTPQFDGDCTITGPYESIEEAKACAKDNVDVVI